MAKQVIDDFLANSSFFLCLGLIFIIALVLFLVFLNGHNYKKKTELIDKKNYEIILSSLGGVENIKKVIDSNGTLEIIVDSPECVDANKMFLTKEVKITLTCRSCFLKGRKDFLDKFSGIAQDGKH